MQDTWEQEDGTKQQSKDNQEGKVAKVGLGSSSEAINWSITTVGRGTSECKAFALLHLSTVTASYALLLTQQKYRSWSHPASAFLAISPSTRRPGYRQSFPSTCEPGCDA